MSRISKREAIKTTVMEPLLNGGYHEVQLPANAWRCDGCGLVWDKKWYAASCEKRGHKARWEQMYCDGTHNGSPVNARYYERRALRRERLAA